MNVLVFNVGSASLKFQVIAMPLDAAFSEQERTVVSGRRSKEINGARRQQRDNQQREQ